MHGVKYTSPEEVRLVHNALKRTQDGQSLKKNQHPPLSEFQFPLFQLEVLHQTRLLTFVNHTTTFQAFLLETEIYPWC